MLIKFVDFVMSGFYEYYCNGKMVKEGVLILCCCDKGVMLLFIIYMFINV